MVCNNVRTVKGRREGRMGVRDKREGRRGSGRKGGGGGRRALLCPIPYAHNYFCAGYINNNGDLNMARFEMYLKAIAQVSKWPSYWAGPFWWNKVSTI